VFCTNVIRLRTTRVKYGLAFQEVTKITRIFGVIFDIIRANTNTLFGLLLEVETRGCIAATGNELQVAGTCSRCDGLLLLAYAIKTHSWSARQ